MLKSQASFQNTCYSRTALGVPDDGLDRADKELAFSSSRVWEEGFT